jgi:hypothetical protein
MTDSPLRQLVMAQLRPIEKKSSMLDTEFYFNVLDAAGPIGAEAVAGCGEGLDLHTGERVLAAMLSRDTPKGYEHRLACAITDRRTVLSGYSSMKGGHNPKRFSVRHDQVVQVDSKEGVLSDYVALITPHGKFELTYPEATSMLAGFYRTMAMQIPYAARCEPPTEFLTPSEQDPTGAQSAAQRLWVQDAQAAQLLALIDQRAKAGELSAEMGQDLASRVVLAHRARCGGPGMNEGGWISAMSGDDFGHTLTSIFGPPTAHQVPQPGTNWLDFYVDPNRDPFGPLFDALGVASYFALGVGFSPGGVIAHAMMKKQPVTQLRFMFNDAQGFSRFQIQTPPGIPLERADAFMAHRAHQALIHSAFRVLERRCQVGWDVPYQQLFAATGPPAQGTAGMVGGAPY